jgi:hypothetical protein
LSGGDYRSLRIRNQNLIKSVSAKSFLDSGLWVPVSVAAYLTSLSKQTIRLKIFSLVNIDSFEIN